MLQVSRQIAQELLVKQVEQGRALIERASLVGDFSDYESWKADRKQWIAMSARALNDVFGSSEEADELNSAASSRAGGQRWQQKYASDLESVRTAVDFLTSLQHRIESAPEPASDSALAQPTVGLDSERWPAGGVDLAQDTGNGSVSSMPVRSLSGAEEGEVEKQIFIVHGRDEKCAQTVVRLLEQAGPHRLVVLHGRPSEGRALLERLAGQAAQSAYAVVLLTADDVGTPRLDLDEEPYFSPRARQSVVFQMGFLAGALTPPRMCVLYEHGVELPSELDGLAYVRLDRAGAWQSKLLLELRSAGFDYDPARLAAQRG